jgi:hypothetical protein
VPTVVKALAQALAPLLPLRLRTAAFTYPTLTLTGELWSLAVTSPWVWRRAEGSTVDWADPTAADAIWDLCGLDITGVKAVSTKPVDPAFLFSDGGRLDVVVDSDWDPWVCRHEQLNVVFVGEGPLRNRPHIGTIARATSGRSGCSLDG